MKTNFEEFGFYEKELHNLQRVSDFVIYVFISTENTVLNFTSNTRANVPSIQRPQSFLLCSTRLFHK
jgi:hypothetical protein